MADNVLAQKSSGPKNTGSENDIYSNADYTPVLGNWFTAKPYGFRFTSKSGSTKVMYLPIGPSNLTITTQFATNITPTIYGTVEEHSPVRYFDITIEGTTGMGPKYVDPVDSENTPVLKNGRTAFSVQQSLSTRVAGFFSKTLGAVDKIFHDANSIKSVPAVSGIQLEQTGYIAFHNLYRFLLKYKKDASGTDKKNDATSRNAETKHPLVFFNYKDNNEYNVIVKSFTLRRDKENPMLYFYSISMRGYELKSIENSSGVSSVQGTDSLLKAFGLNGVKGSTFLSEAKDKAAKAKDILGSVANGINQLGR